MEKEKFVADIFKRKIDSEKDYELMIQIKYCNQTIENFIQVLESCIVDFVQWKNNHISDFNLKEFLTIGRLHDLENIHFEIDCNEFLMENIQKSYDLMFESNSELIKSIYRYFESEKI